MSRPIYVQLSLPALRDNVARARALAPDTHLLAVVKANAYGHGLVRVLGALEDADGSRWWSWRRQSVSVMRATRVACSCSKDSSLRTN